MLNITASRVDERVHLAVDGELTEDTAPILRGAMTAALESEIELTIDFTDCASIDASGTEILVRGAQVLAGAGRRLRLAGLDEEVPRAALGQLALVADLR